MQGLSSLPGDVLPIVFAQVMEHKWRDKEWLVRFQTVRWILQDFDSIVSVAAARERAVRYIQANLTSINDYTDMWATWKEHVSTTKPGDKQVTESWNAMTGGVRLIHILEDATTPDIARRLTADITTLSSLKALLTTTDRTSLKAEQGLLEVVMQIQRMRELARQAIVSSCT